MKENTNREGLVSLLGRRQFLGTMGAVAISPISSGCSTLLAVGESYGDRGAKVETSTEFDQKKAGDNLAIAMLPLVYDHMLLSGRSPALAKKMVSDRLPKGSDFSVIHHGNTVAVVVYERDKNKVTVAYNAAESFSSQLKAVKFFKRSHPTMGGNVHSGFVDAIAEENSHGQKISDAVREQVARYASLQEGVIDLTLTGFSMGGVMASATAAEWMKDKNGLPGGGKTHLTDIMTFGSPPLGDKEFAENFDKACKENGTKNTRIIAYNDIMQRLMTGKKPFGGGDFYQQTGDAVYLLPTKEGVITLVNPEKEALQQHLTKVEEENWQHIHWPDTYAEVLGVPEIRLDRQSGIDLVAPSSLHAQKVSANRELTARVNEGR